MVTIRKATPTDATAIGLLVDEAYRHYIPRVGRKPGPMTVDYLEVIRESLVWVAVEQPEDNPSSAAATPMAVLGVLVLDVADDHLLLENIAVSPQAQGRGLGNQLMGLAEQVAREHQRDRITLYTHVTMVENIAYYQRHGYVETGRRDDHGFSRVFFAKQLT